MTSDSYRTNCRQHNHEDAAAGEMNLGSRSKLLPEVHKAYTAHAGRIPNAPTLRHRQATAQEQLRQDWVDSSDVMLL
jgi:hypothetical protein